jgi:acyl-CoA thioesterase
MSELDLDLRDALKLTREEAHFSAQVASGWAQGRAAFGGLVAALGLRALEQVIPRERLLRSLLVDFVGPLAPGPVQIEARVLRAGRALTQGEARLVQSGAVCAVLLGAFAAPRASALRIAGPRAPAFPAALELPRLAYQEGVTPRFTKHFDYRYASPDALFSSAKLGNIAGYVRHSEPAESDIAGLLCLIDAWPPALMTMLSRPAPGSSVTWMVDFVAPELASQHGWDAFYAYEAKTLAAGDGYGTIESRLWAPDGQLVAASRQLAAEFSGG